jgi:hypothetical protein
MMAARSCERRKSEHGILRETHVRSSCSSIASVAAAALSARSCQETDCAPPAATVGTDCVALRGLSSRIEVLGVKLTSTESPLADGPPEFETSAVTPNVAHRRTLAGMPESASAAAADVRLLEDGIERESCFLE